MDQPQTCRFCLNDVKEYKKIDCFTERTFEALLLKPHLRERSSVICWECMVIAKICLHFKSICLYIEEIIYSFARGRNQLKFDIREIYREIEFGATVDEGIDICRFCMTPSEEKDFVPLRSLIDKSSFMMLPEVDFTIIENPVVCETCQGNLECHLKFTRSCLNVERELKNESCNQMYEQPPKILNEIPEIQRRHVEVVWINDQFSVRKEKRSRKKGGAKNDTKIKRRPKKIYNCSFCLYNTTCKLDLDRHEKLHKDLFHMYRCRLCSFTTRDKIALKKHSESSHCS